MKKRHPLLKALLVILLLACAGVVFLDYNGLLSFHHPLQSPSDGQIRVACVGDSVTYGYGIKNRKKFNYPQQLQELLGGDYCVNNYGYSGRTVSMDGDRPLGKEKLFYEDCIQFRPDIVVFMLGSNDSKPANWNSACFTRDFPQYLKRLRDANPDVKIYVVVPTPVFPVNGEVKYHIDGGVLQNEIVPLVRTLAAQYGDETIDMNGVFTGREDLFSDGCHPTAQGAALFAQTVYDAIHTMLR